ncbi:winged helix-turn-helix transcriptional regulator [Jiulongibacter sp. NS-SX5]|uniref:winged helix-turn-helix transcriptional regulator n=1 Tax=Jiulongibacter sp. NS-SX5 TaxID=3463854 RepID=UPI00405A489F
MMKESVKERFKAAKACPINYVVAINDTLNVISGKWKLPIIGSLLFDKRRFTEIQKNIPKITPRMLSKELKELELNGVVERKVYDTTPVTVEYILTPSGRSIVNVMDTMLEWGLNHRAAVHAAN